MTQTSTLRLYVTRAFLLISALAVLCMFTGKLIQERRLVVGGMLLGIPMLAASAATVLASIVLLGANFRRQRHADSSAIESEDLADEIFGVPIDRHFLTPPMVRAEGKIRIERRGREYRADFTKVAAVAPGRGAEHWEFQLRQLFGVQEGAEHIIVKRVDANTLQFGLPRTPEEWREYAAIHAIGVAIIQDTTLALIVLDLDEVELSCAREVAAFVVDLEEAADDHDDRLVFTHVDAAMQENLGQFNLRLKPMDPLKIELLRRGA